MAKGLKGKNRVAVARKTIIDRKQRAKIGRGSVPRTGLKYSLFPEIKR